MLLKTTSLSQDITGELRHLIEKLFYFRRMSTEVKSFDIGRHRILIHLVMCSAQRLREPAYTPSAAVSFEFIPFLPFLSGRTFRFVLVVLGTLYTV